MSCSGEEGISSTIFACDDEDDEDDVDNEFEGRVDRRESYNDFFTGLSTTLIVSSFNLRKSLNVGAYKSAKIN